MSNEPDRYELDEMMERLKHRSRQQSPEDEGELVTRADGSEAIRVRRHKRRSRQPHKERQRRIRMLQVSAGLVAVLIVILAIGFVTIYVNTAPYRKQVITKVSASTGAEIELRQFRMNPAGANAHGIDMAWPAGNLLESLSMRLLSADVSPFAALTGRLSGDELNAHTGKLMLRLPEDGQPTRAAEPSDGDAPVRFKQCSIKNLEVQLQSQQQGAFRLVGTEATFMPGNDEQKAHLRMSGGDLRARGWPLLRMDRAYIEFEGAEADIIGLSFKHADDDRGVLELSGAFRPYAIDENQSLKVTADSFLLSGLAGDSLGRLFEGRVESTTELGDSTLLLGVGPKAVAKLSMAFSAGLEESIVVQHFPCLYALSQTLGDEWFSRPAFRDVARGQLVREGDRVELKGLDFASRDRMAIKGELKEEAGVLSGHLEIGVSFGMIQAAENQVLEEMFGRPRDGYRWITLTISGTPATPTDDFGKQYESALDRLRQQPQGGTGTATGSVFDELTRPR